MGKLYNNSDNYYFPAGDAGLGTCVDFVCSCVYRYADEKQTSDRENEAPGKPGN